MAGNQTRDPRLVEGFATSVPTQPDPARIIVGPGPVATVPSTLEDGERMTAKGFGPVVGGAPKGQVGTVAYDSQKKKFYFDPATLGRLTAATRKAFRL